MHPRRHKQHMSYLQPNVRRFIVCLAPLSSPTEHALLAFPMLSWHSLAANTLHKPSISLLNFSCSRVTLCSTAYDEGNSKLHHEVTQGWIMITSWITLLWPQHPDLEQRHNLQSNSDMQSGQSLCRNTSLPEGLQHAHPNAAKFIVSRTAEFSPICQSYQSHEA